MKAFLLICLALISLSQSAKLGERLQKDLKTSENKFNIVLSFGKGNEEVVNHVEKEIFNSREEKITTLTLTLERIADLTQSSVKYFLSESKVEFKSTWITNQLFIRGADKSLINMLSDDTKFPEINNIELEDKFKLDNGRKQPRRTFVRQRETEWGIEKIQAPEALELLATATGGNPKPIRVATLDTGVRGSHEALKDNFVTNYGWYDPFDQTTEPYDDIGQGTHSIGVIAGKGGIGVYPDGRWMACKGCYQIFCNQQEILLCAEFLSCPSLPNGSGKNCSYAPHIISNIWGGGQGNTWFNAVIQVWKSIGIVPFFATGTDTTGGGSCGTVASPGDQPGVISSGPLDRNDGLWRFASHGPSVNGVMKPDFSAPGDDIVSSHITDDTAYWSYSGSGFANAHVAGATAILLAYDDKLTYNQVVAALIAGAETDVISTGKTCSDQSDDIFPNNSFGNGRVNALKSLQSLINKKEK